MKGLAFLVKTAAILVSLAAVICAVAVFRDELVDLCHGLSDRFGMRMNKCEEDYSDFADV